MADNATLYIDLKTRFDNVEAKIDKLASLSERASQSISSSFKKVTFTSPPVKAYEQYIDAKNRLDSKSYKNFEEYERLKTQVEKLEGHKRLQEYISYKDKEKQHYESIGKSLTGIGTKLSIGVTAPLVLIGAQALKTAASFEQYKVSFDTMLKSTDKSQKLLKDIEKFAAATPFQLPGLVVGAKRLLAFGIESDKIVEKLKNLGNAAGGNEEVLDRLTLAYGKLQAKGKATMEELNMFIEAGVPLLDELANGFNVTTAELSEMISTGKVGFDDVDKAITRLTTGTGQFAGLIEKQSQTLNGVVSTMKDNINLLGKDIITVILPDLKKLALFVSDVASGFRNMDEGTKKAIVTIAGLAMAAGPLLIIGGKLVPMFAAIPSKIDGVVKGLNALKVAALANPMLALATAISVVAVGVGAWYLKTHDMNGINQDLKSSTEKLKTSLTDYSAIVKKLTGDTSQLSEQEKNLLNIQKQKLEMNIQKQVNDIIVAYNKLKGATTTFDSSGIFYFKSLDERKKFINALDKEIKQLNDSIASGADQITYYDIKLNQTVTKNADQSRKYLQELYGYQKKLSEPIIEFEDNLQKLAPYYADLKNDAELYKKILGGMKPEFRAELEAQLEIYNAKKDIITTAEEEKKKEEELKKITEERKKATEELLEKRKKLREELDQELNNQGKTELQQIEAKRQAELKAASDLYKNTKQIEEYNKAKADINKIYDNQIAEYKKKVDRETLQTKIELLNQEIEAVKSKAKDQINTTGSLSDQELDIIRQADETKKSLLNERFEYQKELLKQEHEEKITYYQKDIESYENNAEMKASIQNKMLAENESYNAELQRLAEETSDKTNKETETSNKSLVSMSASTVSALGNIEDSFSGLQSTLDETQISYVGMAETIGNMTQALSSIAADAIGQIGDANNSVAAAFAGIAAGLQAAGTVVSMVAESMANETQRSLSIIENEYQDKIASIERTLQKQTKSIDEETQKQLEILKAYYEEQGIEIETGYETELELAQEQYEALLEAKEEYDESENERRLEELEAYAESLQGKTDAEIEEAIRNKELELLKKSDKDKIAQAEKIAMAKAEVDKQKILDTAAKKKEEAEKKAAMKKWEAECKMIESENKASKEAFEQQKAMATIQVIIGMLMGIAMIWANAFSSYPPIPAAIIAGIFTGVMGALGGVQLGLIQAQPPPPDQPLPPPPIFQTGGIAPGNRAEGIDSQTVQVSPKEMMLNDEQQANLFNAIATNQLGGNITVEVYAQIYLDSEEMPISKIILKQRHFARNRT